MPTTCFEGVRAASHAEAPACRALLPFAFPATGRAPELLVATGPDGVRGALALDWVAGGFTLALHVLPGWRRRGLGRALVAHAVALVQGETPGLRAWAPVSRDSPADAFLAACGFAVTRTLAVFETDLVRNSAALTARLDRARRRVPAALGLLPLAMAPMPLVAALVGDAFGVPRQEVLGKLAASHHDAYDGQLSQVLMRDGVPAGAILGRRYGDVIEIDINVVAADLRHGVANLMLLEAIGRCSKAAGVQRFRFSCQPHVRDTLNLGERSGALRLPDQLLYGLQF